MRLIKLKSCEQKEVFVKLQPRLIEPFLSPSKRFMAFRPQFLGLTSPLKQQWNHHFTEILTQETFAVDSEWRILTSTSTPSCLLLNCKPQNSQSWTRRWSSSKLGYRRTLYTFLREQLALLTRWRHSQTLCGFSKTLSCLSRALLIRKWSSAELGYRQTFICLLIISSN